MVAKFKVEVEGSVCFAAVPAGFYIQQELYDYYPDGTRELVLTIVPENPTA